MIKNIIYTLYTLIIVCIGFATIIEKYKGTQYVSDYIYGSWWFIVLWGILTVAAVAYMVKDKLYKRYAVMLLHVSFVAILAGALTTFLTAKRGSANLRMGEPQNTYTSKDTKEDLPFTLKLTNFKVVNYPGTDAPLDYQSIIHVRNQQNGKEENVTISMNNIGNVSGYRLFLASYDSDNNGVTLGVYHDPYGIALTYIGYAMLLLGMICTMLSRSTHIRSLYRKATQPVVVFILMMCATSLHAEELPVVDADIAHKFGTVNVLYNNRICPINTVATDFVTKLTGSPKWNGYSADEIFASWMIYYSPWENQKIIKIKSKEVQKLLGIDSQWASYSDFVDQYNEYKLKEAVSNVAKGKGHISKKDLYDADEKFNVIAMFYQGQMLRIFPYIIKGQAEWYSPGGQVLPKEIPVKEGFFIKQSMDFLTESIVTGQKARALEIIAKIKLFQKDMAGDVLPSPAAIKAEIFYNTLSTQKWFVFLTLTLSLCICIAVSTSWKRSKERWFRISSAAFMCIVFLYLTLLLGLRWWVSGHIPVSNGYETMIFMAWALIIITAIMHRKFPIMAGFGTLIAAFCMLVSVLAGKTPQITPLMPVLQSPLLSIHVMTVMCAYALFALQVLLGIQALWQLHKKETEYAEKTTALSQLLLYPAVFLLGIGIFLGAIWANVSWGAYWTWDPKETWALITFMVYAVPIHKTSIKKFNNVRTYHIYIICAFLTVLITYFGVNFILGGMHSYA